MNGDNKSIKIPIDKALNVFKTDSENFLSHFWEFFSLIAFGDIEFSKLMYDHLENIKTRPWQKPLVSIGKAKFLSISGKLFESHVEFQNTRNQMLSFRDFPSSKIENEIWAFLSYEQAILAGKIKDTYHNHLFLQAGAKLTAIEKLSHAFELQIQMYLANQNSQDLSKFESAIIRIQNDNMPSLACVGWRNAAIFARNSGNFSLASTFLHNARSIAESCDLKIMQNQIQATSAIQFIKLNKLDKARYELSLLTSQDELDPNIPTRLEILAVIEEKEGNLNRASELILEALKLSIKLDNIDLIPGEYLYLGQVYENHYNDFEQAEYYYKQGYDHAMRYASHGISLTGDRKNVVDAYVKFIKRQQASSAPSKPSKPIDHFAFSQGKPWKEIKDIFQHQLICYHQGYQQNSKALANKLSMPPSTLYSLQDRLKKKGYQLPDKNATGDIENHNLFSFIEEHEDLTWEAINSIFEREIIHYLYEKYGYNKQRMAQVLKLSYPSIITKTRELTQVNEHLLPN